MDMDTKRDLLITSSRNPRTGKGPQSYKASLQDDLVDPYDKVVALSTSQYGNHYEAISATTEASQLHMLKQNG